MWGSRRPAGRRIRGFDRAALAWTPPSSQPRRQETAEASPRALRETCDSSRRASDVSARVSSANRCSMGLDEAASYVLAHIDPNCSPDPIANIDRCPKNCAHR